MKASKETASLLSKKSNDQGKKKILYVQHAAGMGGSVISLRTVVLDAIRVGYDVVVIVPNQEVAAFYLETKAKIIIQKIIPLDHNSSYFYRFNPRDFLRFFYYFFLGCWSIPSFIKTLLQERPDVVHLNGSNLLFYGIVSDLLHIPVVWHIREHIAQGYFGVRKKILQYIFEKYASAVIYISEDEKNIFPLRNKNQKIIYNYVKKEYYSEWSPAPNGDRFTISSLGGTNSIKGAAALVEAAGFLPDHMVVQIIGSKNPLLKKEKTPYEKKICSKLLAMKSGASVEFLDPVSDVRPLLSRTSVLVFWGIVPHFPRPIFEAWLFHIPVIALYMKGMNANITEENCLVIDADSPAKLARGILRIEKDSAFSQRISERGFQVSESLFVDNFSKIDVLYSGFKRLR